MESLEKNDIDLSKLFNWGGSFDLYDVNNKLLMKVYIRLVSDEHLNRARVYGLRKSAELRKKLKTEGSDEKLAYIPDIEFVEKENVVEQLILFKIKDYTTQAFNELKFNVPKEPDSQAELEEMEKHQKEIDEFPEKRQDQIRNYITNLVDRDREKYYSLDLKTIFNEYEKYLIDQLCESEMVLKFREMCVYYGTYSDKEFKNKLFKDFSTFMSINSEIKDQLIDAYMSLEIGGENLKNLQEVTQ